MVHTTKRSVAVLGSVGLLAVALAACSSSGGGSTGGDTNSGAGKTLNVYIANNAQYPNEQKAWFESTSAKFKAQTGATVQWETFASANDELTKIQTSVVSGQGPDVYSLGTTFTPTAYGTGAFVKLGDKEWSALGGKEKFVPATLGISGPDPNNLVGIPFNSRPFVMAYNKDLLKAAGIDKPASSWDELAAQAKKLTTGGVYGMAIAYKDNFDPWKFAWGMSIQAGNPIIDGKTAKLDDPTTKKAYETYFGWLTKDKVVDPASIGWSNAQALAAFSQGKAAYFPMTTYTSAPTLDKSEIKDKYAYALLPTIPPGATSLPSGGKDAASILSGDNVVVADYSQNKDLAFQFVKLITDPEIQNEYFKIFGNLPVNAQAAAALKSDQKLSVFTEASAKSVATPFTGAWGDTQLALTNVVVQSIPDLSKGSVSDADLTSRLAAAQKSAQSAVDRAK
jgi:multiple sugar transport system substrate-binding protein